MAKSKSRNFFVWIIMGLLFVGLMGFGATGLSGNVRTVGTVGDKPITTQTYYSEVRTQIQIAQAQQGTTLSFPQAEAQGIPQRALASIVGQRVLDNEVAQLGLSVGDEAISAAVLATPAFRGTDGTFDRARYREALSQSGLTVKEFETSLREEQARAMLQGAVFTGIPDQGAFGTAFANFLREERDFTWATLTAAEVDITLPEPTDAELMAHYEANPVRYTAPETRAVRYAWLTPDMIQDDVPVSEEELRDEYQARLDEFVVPERRLVERLVFSDEAAAQEAMDAIAAEETTFVALVEGRGLSLSDVDIGDVSEADLGEAGAPVFALENGEVTGPHPSEFGPALFRMNAVLAARNTTFEEALPDLREDEAAARARRMIEDQIDPITDLLAGGASVDDLVEQTEMELGTLDWSAEVTEGIAAYETFREVAAATTPEDFPDLHQLEDGGLFVLEVTEVTPPALTPLEDIRADVVSGWEAEATTQAVLDEAETRADTLREGAVDFPDAELSAFDERGIQRRGFINDAPRGFVQMVFDMEPGEVRVLPHDGAAVIVRLDTIHAADTSDEAYEAELATQAETASEGIAQDIYEMFTRTVQLRTEVTINDAALNAVHANFR